MSTARTFRVEPGGALRGRLRVPGDKSISHRAIILGSLADGVTEIDGFLEGADAIGTIHAFRRLGIEINGPDRGRVVVHGRGIDGLRAPDGPLDLGNSGTSMRLLAGLLAAQPFDTELIGDASLMRRPMKRVTEPLALMGARIEAADAGTPPLRIRGGRALVGIEYDSPVASAQVKSALLLAGLYADGCTLVREPAESRDHTERMLGGFGYDVERGPLRSAVMGGGRLRACAVDIPADISSAAFFLVGATIAPGSDLVLEHVGMNPTRTGVIEVLRAMGANIEVLAERTAGGEPVADLRVRAAELHGIDIPAAVVPRAIDEFPALFIAAACAQGTTRLTGAEELRVKESDRIQVMADGLQALGVDAQPAHDGLEITGGHLDGGRVDSAGDHRVAMSFAIAALRAGSTITIDDCRNVDTSFPGFVDSAHDVGLDIRALDQQEAGT